MMSNLPKLQLSFVCTTNPKGNGPDMLPAYPATLVVCNPETEEVDEVDLLSLEIGEGLDPTADGAVVNEGPFGLQIMRCHANLRREEKGQEWLVLGCYRVLAPCFKMEKQDDGEGGEKNVIVNEGTHELDWEFPVDSRGFSGGRFRLAYPAHFEDEGRRPSYLTLRCGTVYSRFWQNRNAGF